MAWSAVTSRGTATSNTSGTTVAMPPSAAITVDKIALVWCVGDNISTADGASSDHSISDTDGHTWTKLKEWTRSAGAAADGVTTSVFATKVTAEIGTADTITITFTSAITAKVMGVGEATVDAGNTFELEPSSDVAAVGTSTSPSVANSGLTSQEYLFIGVLGYEAVPTITADADYTLLNEASAGSGLAGVKGYCSTRIATLTGDTYNPTGSLSRDFSIVLVALDEIAEGGSTPIAASDTVAISLSEAASLLARSTVTDVPTMSLAEAVTLLVRTTPADTLSVSLAEVIAAKAKLSATDPLAVAVTDAASLLIREAKSAADTLGILLTDAASVLAREAKSVADTLGVSLADAVNLLARSTRTDALGVSVSEAAVLLSRSTRTDTLSVSLGEGITLLGRAQVSDTLGVQVLDTATVRAILAVADALGIAVADAAVVVAIVVGILVGSRRRVRVGEPAGVPVRAPNRVRITEPNQTREG